jgi:hypothetical protein
MLYDYSLPYVFAPSIYLSTDNADDRNVRWQDLSDDKYIIRSFLTKMVNKKMTELIQECKRYGIVFDQRLEELDEMEDLLRRLEADQDNRNDEGLNPVVRKIAIEELRQKIRLLAGEIEEIS